MRVLTLLLRHGTEKYQEAIPECRELFKSRLTGICHDMVVIDNALPEDYEEPLAGNATLIGGCNSNREFSGWNCGLRHIGNRIWQYQFVHLCTSAFRALPGPFLNHIDSEMLRLILGRGVVLGHIDYFNDPVGILGRRLQAWIRTSFMFMPPEELLLLGSLVSIDEHGLFFSGNPRAPFRSDAPLSANYQRYIIDWLTGAGTGQGVTWHSRFELNSKTLPSFEGKAIAVLNEQMLSLRLRAHGCAMLDIMWLAAHKDQLQGTQALGAIPFWRGQVTNRGTGAAPRA